MTKKVHLKAQSTGGTVSVVVGISVLAGLYFLFSTIRLVKNIQYGVLGAPATYAALVAFFAGVYAWHKGAPVGQKYILFCVLTTIVTGYATWFFGLTYAKVYVPSPYSLQELREGVCNAPGDYMAASGC